MTSLAKYILLTAVFLVNYHNVQYPALAQDAIIEDIECTTHNDRHFVEESTLFVTQTITETSTISEHPTLTVHSPTIIPGNLDFEQCEIYDVQHWKMYFEFFIMALAVWPIILYFPRRRRKQQIMIIHKRRELYIQELETKVATVQMESNNMSGIISKQVETNKKMDGTINQLRTRLEFRQQELGHEREKVAIFLRQHLELSDMRVELQFSLQRLQQENEDLRAQMRDLSCRYKRVVSDLPHLLLPPTIIATSTPIPMLPKTNQIQNKDVVRSK